MSRAQELREAGATTIGDKSEGTGGTASTPFVKWPPAAPPASWIEGTVQELWEGKYGVNATIVVTNSGGLADEHRVGEKANVGLASATLKDRVTEDHIGEVLHFEFLGWVEPANGGNRYRHFEIQIVPEELRYVVHGGRVLDLSKDDDDELPF
tara:strand:+ start:58 stop:516 length:459 start_codon:yes stop_codon:yes gene_type:complete